MNSTPTILEREDLPWQITHWSRHPKTLWCLGDLALLDTLLVSVIGSRKVSREGILRARRLSKILVGEGVTVVSGLAEGIDSAAHTETLSAGGKTIAVMGTPIDQCYPAQNADLKDRIVRYGLVISQFPIGRPVSRGNFPQRNELMAALSALTIVVEAGVTSGTRHQVASAIALGRKVGFMASLVDRGIPWVDESLAKRNCFVVNEPEDIKQELAALSPKLEVAPLPEISLTFEPQVFTKAELAVELSEPRTERPDHPTPEEVVLEELPEASEVKHVVIAEAEHPPEKPPPRKRNFFVYVILALWRFFTGAK